MAKKQKLPYWQMRNVDQEEYMQRGIDPVQSKIAKAYLQAQKYLTDEVNKLFSRARLTTNSTEAELKRALNVSVSPSEVLEYQRLAKSIETPEIAEQAQKQLNILAYKHRITRLEDLRAKSWLVAKQVADIEYQEQTDFYIKEIHKSYRYATAEDVIQRLEDNGVAVQTWNRAKRSGNVPIEVWNQDKKHNGHEFKELSTKETKNILETHWKGSNYSERIWKDTDTLAKRLEELFTVEAMTGMSNQDMARTIAKEFETSIFVANRLIRTEANYVSNQAKLKAWKDRGVEKYMIVAVLDLRTSSICRKWDGKVHKVADAEVGVNFPPGHPHCRSIAVAYYGYRSTIGQRTVRDPIGGGTFIMKRDQNYNDWMNALLERYSHEEIETQKKKIKHLSRDNKDYKRLKDVVGKDAPESLDDYQNIKYNNGRDWQLTKLDYQRRVRLERNPELALPNADVATIDDRKFTEYLFNESSKSGYPKGKLISSSFGYGKDNYQEFKDEILKRSLSYPARDRGNNGYGNSYEQKMIMYNNKGKPYNFVVGWFVKGNETKMSTIMIKEVKK